MRKAKRDLRKAKAKKEKNVASKYDFEQIFERYKEEEMNNIKIVLKTVKV